jgi:hypothetical protein
MAGVATANPPVARAASSADSGSYLLPKVVPEVVRLDANRFTQPPLNALSLVRSEHVSIEPAAPDVSEGGRLSR